MTEDLEVSEGGVGCIIVFHRVDPSVDTDVTDPYETQVGVRKMHWR